MERSDFQEGCSEERLTDLSLTFEQEDDNHNISKNLSNVLNIPIDEVQKQHLDH